MESVLGQESYNNLIVVFTRSRPGLVNNVPAIQMKHFSESMVLPHFAELSKLCQSRFTFIDNIPVDPDASYPGYEQVAATAREMSLSNILSAINQLNAKPFVQEKAEIVIAKYNEEREKKEQKILESKREFDELKDTFLKEKEKFAAFQRETEEMQKKGIQLTLEEAKERAQKEAELHKLVKESKDEVAKCQQNVIQTEQKMKTEMDVLKEQRDTILLQQVGERARSSGKVEILKAIPFIGTVAVIIDWFRS